MSYYLGALSNFTQTLIRFRTTGLTSEQDSGGASQTLNKESLQIESNTAFFDLSVILIFLMLTIYVILSSIISKKHVRAKIEEKLLRMKKPKKRYFSFFF